MDVTGVERIGGRRERARREEGEAVGANSTIRDEALRAVGLDGVHPECAKPLYLERHPQPGREPRCCVRFETDVVAGD